MECRHGATVGQLDEEALFYLCSRGIDKELARRLLIDAFSDEIIRRVNDLSLQSILKDFLSEYLLSTDPLREIS